MHRPLAAVIFVVAAVAVVVTVTVALAQGNPPGTVTWSCAATGTGQLSGNLVLGGDARWSNLAFSGGVTRQFVPAFAAGLSVRYGDEAWRIQQATAFGDRAPWRHLQRPGASLNLSLALSRTLVVGVSPTADWAYDSRADVAEACTYGAVLSAFGVASPRFVLGGGVSLTRQFYSMKSSPFLIVNWRLSDRLRIANAPAAGPLGGAGVELRFCTRAGLGAGRRRRVALGPLAARGALGIGRQRGRDQLDTAAGPALAPPRGEGEDRPQCGCGIRQHAEAEGFQRQGDRARRLWRRPDVLGHVVVQVLKTAIGGGS